MMRKKSQAEALLPHCSFTTTEITKEQSFTIPCYKFWLLYLFIVNFQKGPNAFSKELNVIGTVAPVLKRLSKLSV